MEPVRGQHPDGHPDADRVNAATATTARRPAPLEDAFLEHRPLLHAIAYRMLGSVHDAEDAVQDAYLRWMSQDPQTVANPAGFLTTVVTRLCLDRLRSAAVRRELYVGPWLPEPLPTATANGTTGCGGADPAAAVAVRESASIGMLMLLDQLSPAERAVFVLREAFDVPYAEIARIIEHTPESCRQLHHRAGRRVATTPKRRGATRPPDPARDQRIVEGFLAAARSGDLAQLTTLLREDVIVYNDGGGKASTGFNPIRSAAKVARLYTHVFPKRFAEGATVTFQRFNDAPGMIVRRPLLTFVYTFDLDEDGRIAHIYMVANPDKLTHLVP
ncbi:RNA polymerase sigma factor SigJ [Actinospica durhamensis]|uniref:RNA polymerase sigma factor SigJ n=1 Tax=Actinospica durhamensis TaxID=1508375 RepID=A0A941EU66_9ACTN|nr:RNA polymerase sigma factor SigJ [Actinospica durhamensis]MBR7837361.1 RNA polymerase sigma factor SigJ [Actinospica durhamensis]